jgi:hypothetical protein
MRGCGVYMGGFTSIPIVASTPSNGSHSLVGSQLVPCNMHRHDDSQLSWHLKRK